MGGDEFEKYPYAVDHCGSIDWVVVDRDGGAVQRGADRLRAADWDAGNRVNLRHRPAQGRIKPA